METISHILESVDGALEQLAHHSPSIWLTFLIVALLGLRHASDPDHLAAVSTLVAEKGLKAKQAMKTGASWGWGHAVSMVLFGLPVVLFSTKFPESMYQVAEATVGVIILYYAGKLAWQAYKGKFHFHGKKRPPEEHDHSHVHAANKRSFGMGLIHGLGGSYGASLLVLATFNSSWAAAMGLGLFSLLSVVSMALMTGLFAYSITHHKLMHYLTPAMYVLAGLSLVFGVLYIQAALG